VEILAAACVASALAWVYLLTAHGGFWMAGQRLPRHTGTGEPGWPAVTVVVPARNEAAMLPVTLPSLLAQDYPGELRVVLVDDESTDATSAVAASMAGQGLHVVAGRPAPPGWAGKVWAMAQGSAHAAGAEYLLFTDADIEHAAGSVTALVRAAREHGMGLVSQMALLRAETFWERVIVPAFVYFFAQLYPFRRVNRPGTRTAAAAGGCMLVRREVLAAAGGLEPIRGALIDDVALASLLKRQAGARCWLGLSTQVVSRRQYPRLADLWDMIARSAYVQLRYSPALLAATVAGLLWLYLLPPAAGLAGLALLAPPGGPPAAWLAAAGLAGWAIMTVTFLPVLRLYRLSFLRAPALPLVALLYAVMTADSARRHYSRRQQPWRGPRSPAPDGRLRAAPRRHRPVPRLASRRRARTPPAAPGPR
jgi:hopene-associated glycosyltransferase HpnB